MVLGLAMGIAVILLSGGWLAISREVLEPYV